MLRDITFDNSQQTGLTYDEAVGGPHVLPSFDKNQQYNVRFDSNVVAEDRGILGISSVGGRPYTRLYPSDTGFDQQEINNGYEDDWIHYRSSTKGISVPIRKDCIPKEWPSLLSSSQVGLVLVHSTYLVLPSRELLLQVAQHLYSTLLVVLDERFIAQTPEGTVLFDISDTANESVTKDFVGSGSITLSKWSWNHYLQKDSRHQGCWFCILLWFWCYQIQFRSTRRNLPTHLWRRILRLQGFLCYSVSESNVTSGWRTYSPRYRLHTSLWYRSEHWYRDRHVPLAGGGTSTKTEHPGIVTTRFLPKYPATGRITIDGKAIGRTNAPILTDGTIYILGIGTEGNGQIGDDGIGDLNGVEFGAKERFVPAFRVWCWISPIRLPDNWGRSKTSQGLWLLWRRQRSWHIWTNHHTSGRWYSHNRENCRTRNRIWYIHLQWCWSRRMHNICRNWFWFSIRNRRYCRVYNCSELVAGTSIFNGTAEESFSAQTPEDTATITLSGTGVASKKIRACWFWNSYTQQRSKSRYWYHTFSNRFWYIQYSWWCCRINSRTICCKKQFLQISQVLQKQDTSKYSKTSFHLVHSHYLENSHIQRSTSHQRTLDLELLQSLDLPTRWILSERLVLVLQPSLVHQLSDLQQILSRVQSSSIQKADFCSHRTQSSLRILRRRQRSRHIWYYYNLWCWYYKTNTSLWLLRRRQRSWHIGWIYILQYSSRTPICRLHTFDWYWCCSPLPDKWNGLSNPSPSPTTRLKEDSKDLLDLRNLSLVQLTLELVRLIPSNWSNRIRRYRRR